MRLLEVEKPTLGISSENFSESTVLFTEITSPLQFAKYRIDPSIPENAQKIQLTFRTNQNYSKKEWTLDGKSISSDFIGISSLASGNHTLTLRLFQNDTSTPIEEKTRIFEIVPQE